MSNFNYEKKQEHEKAAEKALMQDDFPTAFYHVAEAAKYGLALANQCSGRLRDAYISNANELMDLAEKCKAKCNTAKSQRGGEKMSVEGDDSSQKAESCRMERPSVRLADVAGMENVKRQIRLRMIEPLQVNWICPSTRLRRRIFLESTSVNQKTTFAHCSRRRGRIRCRSFSSMNWRRFSASGRVKSMKQRRR